MATLTYRTSAAGGSTSGTGNRTLAMTPAIGDLWIVAVAVAGNTQSAATCADNNTIAGTYVRLGGALYNASADYFTLFARTAPFLNATSTTVTATTGSNTAGALHIIAISGSHKFGGSCDRQIKVLANQAAGGTPAPAFDINALTTNMTLGFVANANSVVNMTTPTGWTERQENAFASGSVNLESVTRDSGFASTTVTWGSTSSTAFACAILELDGYDERSGFVMYANNQSRF